MAGAAAVVASAGCTTTEVARGDGAAVAEERQRQMQLVLETWLDRRGRVDALGYPILVANAHLCGDDVEPVFGVSWVTSGDLDREMDDYREVLAESYGVAERPTVVNVVPGSPAARAGLQRWDVLLSFDGKPVPAVRRARQARRQFAEVLDEAAADGVVDVVVERAGSRLAAEVATETACGSRIHLVQDDAVNAFADGNDIYITMGMYRFVEHDLEMQVVIAHELAHNAEGHIRKSMGSTALAVLLDALVDAAADVDTDGTFGQLSQMAFSKEFEREADYISMYMLERAGIDAVEASNFWRRIAVESPEAVVVAGTHPTSAERFVNLDAAYEEIRQKRAAGEPIEPERR